MAITVQEDYAAIAHRTINDVVDSFHLKALSMDGELLVTAAPFQIADYGNPWRAGKASAEELQAETSRLISTTPPLQGNQELRQLAIDNELGTDCSNFVYHCLDAMHQKMGLGGYADRVYRDTSDIAQLAVSKSNWGIEADADEITPPVQRLSARAISQSMHKEPQFIVGAKHIADPNVTKKVDPSEALPGDIVAFRKIGSLSVVHVGIIFEASPPTTSDDTVACKIWHSLWQEEALQGGVRQDLLMLYPDGSYTYSWPSQAHTRLEHTFLRPLALTKVSS